MRARAAFVGTLVLLPVLAAAGQNGTGSLVLHLASGDFRPLEAAPSVPGWFRAASIETSPRGQRYLVAVTGSPLGPEDRQRLRDLGVELLDVLPRSGYRMRLDPGVEASVRRLPFVAWLGALPAHLKVSPQLALRASEPAGETSLLVVLAPGEPLDRVADTLPGTTVRAAPSGKDGAWRVTVVVPPDRLAPILSGLAALPEVEAVEPVRTFRPLNQDGVWVHQSFVGPSPQQTPVFDHGVFGCGQVVAVADTAQDYDLCFFRDAVLGAPPVSMCNLAPCSAATPATNRRKDILYYNWSGTPTGEEDTCPATITGASGHGTHTSGSVAGDNAPYADCAGYSSPNRNGGDGQAPGAKLVVQEMGDGVEYLNDLGGTVWNLADVAYRTGAAIHSNSWGGACYDLFGTCTPGCTMPYDSYARDADLAMWTYPDLLVVTAAGNAGWYCPAPVAVGTPAIAKSPLGVGSVGHGANANVPSSFSSPGPVFDGRLKPEVAAQGEATVSAASDASLLTNNCATCALDGSSMAAPTVAGLAALVREYYEAGFHATGSRNPGLGFTPTGALLKATLIDGAVALGAEAPGPDFVSGFGRVLLDATLQFPGSPFQLRVDDHREGVTTGGVVSHAYDVAPGTAFRATLVWSDYPAALAAATARVNELKLEVVDPAGTVWFQKLDPVSGLPVRTSNATDAHDSLNVVERLVFDEPSAGRWVVRVRGVSVPWGPQPFALVVRGALTDCPQPAAPPAPVLATPADHQVLVSWSAVPGAAAYNVYRSVSPCPGGSWIPVAVAATETAFLDETVSGGVTYSYVVTSSSDPGGSCESPRSPCASIVPAGDCFLAPAFRGAESATSAGLAGCAVNLSWDPATAYCTGDVRYNVYRGTSSTFVPGPSNRIARCVIGTAFSDSADLVHGATSYYVVRAEDSAAGHGGPCRGGNEEANLAVAAGSPDGPPVLGTWSDDAGDTGTAKLTPASPWLVGSSGGNLGPRAYTVTPTEGACADLTSPALTLADPGQGPQIVFSTRHDLAYDPTGEIFGREGSLGQVEIAAGPSFSNWTRVLLTPNYPAPIDFPFNDCPTTQDLTSYFSGNQPTYLGYTGSLVNWGGGDVRLRFHASGDYLYPGGSWWIDDVSVTKAMVPGSCTTIQAGPPPVPDGAIVLGEPLRASRDGNDVIVTWDASQCPAAAINVYRGVIGDYSTFTAGACNLPPTGSATLAIPGNSWFLAAATDGVAADGSWGRTPSGGERSYSGASLACPFVTQHLTNNGCP